MTYEQAKRVARHLTTPVCGTRDGVRRHLAAVTFNEARLLCYAFNCSANEITERFWNAVRHGWSVV